MQISLRATTDGVAILGFDLDGRVHEAIELLAPEQRRYTWPPAADGIQLRYELFDAMHDPHRGLLGRRGSVWADESSFRFLWEWLHVGAMPLSLPWEPRQKRDPLTLIAMAELVGKDSFRVPDTSGCGLVPNNPLHQAVEQAMLIQAAYRSLRLHRQAFPA